MLLSIEDSTLLKISHLVVIHMFWNLRKKYIWGPRYWNVPVLVNTGTFLVYQYCRKMWYLCSLECASVIQKLTILEYKSGLVLSNARVPVSGTWSILFPNLQTSSYGYFESLNCFISLVSIVRALITKGTTYFVQYSEYMEHDMGMNILKKNVFGQLHNVANITRLCSSSAWNKLALKYTTELTYLNQIENNFF